MVAAAGITALLAVFTHLALINAGFFVAWWARYALELGAEVAARPPERVQVLDVTPVGDDDVVTHGLERAGRPEPDAGRPADDDHRPFHGRRRAHSGMFS